MILINYIYVTKLMFHLFRLIQGAQEEPRKATPVVDRRAARTNTAPSRPLWTVSPLWRGPPFGHGLMADAGGSKGLAHDGWLIVDW